MRDSLLFAIVGVGFGFGASAPGATEILESDALRLEVDTGSTYTFRVIEKTTQRVLVQQAQTRFTIGGASCPVVTANNPVRTADSLQLTFTLSGSTDLATVLFTFWRPDVLRLRLAHDKGTATAVREQFNDQGEHYYGLFEYPFAGAIDNRGLDRDIIGYASATGVNYANARAPFYVTTGGYGIYAESSALGHCGIAITGGTNFSFNESSLTYYILQGSPKQVLQSYNAIAGGTYIPPDWAFGTIWWRDNHHQDLDGLANAQARVLEDARRLQQLGIPAAAMWIDRPWTTGSWGWGGLDAARNRFVFDDQGNSSGDGFPNPAQMIRDVNACGMQLMLWIANRHDSEMYIEARSRGYFFPGWESKTQPAIDLSKPDAYAWFRDRLLSLVDIGIRGYKIDRGHEGEMPTSAENRNVPLCHQMAAESMGNTPDGTNSAFLFARNAYDKSRRYTAVWSGDSQNDWAGLQVSVKNFLRCASMNFPMWGSDTGGYYGATPTKELFARWLAFSAHTPMMEMLQGPGRTIWDDYDAELVNIARTHCRTHHELIPYVRSHLYQASKTGLAVARPMVFEYPDDPNTVNMWDQYLYGDALLVAPVTTIGATSRTVYLPASGTPWLDCNNKLLSYAPGQTITPAAPLNTIPVLLRAGSIAVQGDILRANQRGADWTGPAWAGPSLRIEAFLPTGTFSSSLPYFRGMTAIPPVGPISLAKSASGISLRIDGLDAGDAKTMAARFYFDAATASAYTQGHLAVQAYRNGAPLSSTVSYDAATRQLDMVLWQVSADADHDGDVDGADYGVFASCFNGSGQPIAPSCGTHDFDLDGDVDGADFGVFAACFNGSGNPPACS